MTNDTSTDITVPLADLVAMRDEFQRIHMDGKDAMSFDSRYAWSAAASHLTGLIQRAEERQR